MSDDEGRCSPISISSHRSQIQWETPGISAVETQQSLVMPLFYFKRNGQVIVKFFLPFVFHNDMTIPFEITQKHDTESAP